LRTPAKVADYLELTKPRITTLVLVTAAAGFYLGSPAAFDAITFLHMLIGVALVAAGTNAVNQVLERDTDALMRRTRSRPLPTGRIALLPAALFSGALAAGGVLYLASTTNVLTGALALATFLSYAFLYTPFKRVHSSATVIGAVPGALPILGGWTAATGSLEAGGWVLFGILFVWQMPHFLTLSWLLRDDYDAAGMRMLSVGDRDGFRTRHQTLIYTLTLLPLSLLPTVIGLTGALYFFAALALGLGFVALASQFCREINPRGARKMFRFSILYLPLLLGALAVDKL